MSNLILEWYTEELVRNLRALAAKARRLMDTDAVAKPARLSNTLDEMSVGCDELATALREDLYPPKSEHEGDPDES